MWWDNRWSHVGSPPRPGLRTIYGEIGGGGSSGCNYRGACLVWGWPCQSITSMPSSSSRLTPPTEGQTQGTDICTDMYWSEDLILGGRWPTTKLVMLEDAAGRCEKWLPAAMPLGLHSAEAWAQVPLVVVRASYPPHRVRFWQFEQIHAHEEPAGGQFLWFLPAQRSQYGPAAVLLTSLSTWYNISTFNLIFGQCWNFYTKSISSKKSNLLNPDIYH